MSNTACISCSCHYTLGLGHMSKGNSYAKWPRNNIVSLWSNFKSSMDSVDNIHEAVECKDMKTNRKIGLQKRWEAFTSKRSSPINCGKIKQHLRQTETSVGKCKQWIANTMVTILQIFPHNFIKEYAISFLWLLTFNLQFLKISPPHWISTYTSFILCPVINGYQ